MFFTVATVGETLKDYHFKLGVFHIIRFFFAHSKQSEKYDGTIDETSPISRVNLVTFFTLFSLAISSTLSMTFRTIPSSCMA